MRRPSLAFATAPAQDDSERRGIHVAAAAGIVASFVALVAILGTDAGAPWSVESMAMILVPPLAYGALLLVAVRILVPIGLFGEWMDAGIG